MTRITVAREGLMINNCVIEPGALKLPDDEIPVDWNGNKDVVIGKATKFERNENNEISCEIELFPSVQGLDITEDMGGFVFVSPFEAEEHPIAKGALAKVTSGHIKMVSVQDLGDYLSPEPKK